MAIFRQYIVPLVVVLVFLVALAATSVRTFLPGDLAAPAPIEDIDAFRENPTIPEIHTVS